MAGIITLAHIFRTVVTGAFSLPDDVGSQYRSRMPARWVGSSLHVRSPANLISGAAWKCSIKPKLENCYPLNIPTTPPQTTLSCLYVVPYGHYTQCTCMKQHGAATIGDTLATPGLVNIIVVGLIFAGLILLVGLVVCAIILLTGRVVRSVAGGREHQNELR